MCCPRRMGEGCLSARLRERCLVVTRSSTSGGFGAGCARESFGTGGGEVEHEALRQLHAPGGGKRLTGAGEDELRAASSRPGRMGQRLESLPPSLVQLHMMAHELRPSAVTGAALAEAQAR